MITAVQMIANVITIHCTITGVVFIQEYNEIHINYSLLLDSNINKKEDTVIIYSTECFTADCRCP